MMTVKCECGSYRRRHWISVTPFQNVSSSFGLSSTTIHIASLKCAWINFTNRNVCNIIVWYVRFKTSNNKKIKIFTSLWLIQKFYFSTIDWLVCAKSFVNCVLAIICWRHQHHHRFDDMLVCLWLFYPQFRYIKNLCNISKQAYMNFHAYFLRIIYRHG